VRRRSRGIERLEFFGQLIETIERAAIVVFVMALDERGEIPLRVKDGRTKASWYFMSRLQKMRFAGRLEGKASELPERLGAFAALLRPGEADVGQRPIVRCGSAGASQH